MAFPHRDSVSDAAPRSLRYTLAMKDDLELGLLSKLTVSRGADPALAWKWIRHCQRSSLMKTNLFMNSSFCFSFVAPWLSLQVCGCVKSMSFLSTVLWWQKRVVSRLTCCLRRNPVWQLKEVVLALTRVSILLASWPVVKEGDNKQYEWKSHLMILSGI